jgi:hypothetical protein
MLSYALLIALLYAGENKSLKTLLAIATALTMLKGNSTKKVRRPRSRRARKILAERAIAKKEKKEEILDKVQLVLPVIIKAIELFTANTSNNIPKAEERDPREDIKNEEDKNAFAEHEDSSLTDNEIADITIIEDDEDSLEVDDIVYNAEDMWKKDRIKSLAEEIKDAFHGTTVNLALKSGEKLQGEVVGEYKGFLILGNYGILKYVDSTDIESFS